MMSKVLLLVAIITSPIGCSSPNQPPPVINIDVYYTHGCHHIPYLFEDKLLPNMRVLATFVNLRLIPFGIDDTVYEQDINGEFRCFQPTDNATKEQQRKIEICKKNTLHACGIHSTSNSADQVKYVTCLLKDENVEKCSQEAGLDYNTIKQCEDGEEGIKLLNQHGRRTLKKRIGQVHLGCQPFMVYNEASFTESKWEYIQDIRQEACNRLKIISDACKPKVKLDIYYTSLCHLSAKLFEKISEEWNSLSTFFDLTLIPNGFSRQIVVDEFTIQNGALSSQTGYYECEFGDQDCKGNILHGCGFNMTKDPILQMRYAACLFNKSEAITRNEDVSECSRIARLNDTLIQNCLTNGSGEYYFKRNHFATIKLLGTTLHLTTIPWVVLNKKTPITQWNSGSFLANVCTYISDSLPCFWNNYL